MDSTKIRFALMVIGIGCLSNVLPLVQEDNLWGGLIVLVCGVAALAAKYLKIDSDTFKKK